MRPHLNLPPPPGEQEAAPHPRAALRQLSVARVRCHRSDNGVYGALRGAGLRGAHLVRAAAAVGGPAVRREVAERSAARLPSLSPANPLAGSGEACPVGGDCAA